MPPGDPPTLAGRSGSILLLSHCSAFLRSWFMQDFVSSHTLQVWSFCFPQSCGNLVIKSCRNSNSDSLRNSLHPFARSPGWERNAEWAQNLHKSGRISLVLLFSVYGFAHLAAVGLIFIMIVPFLPKSHCNFFFIFGWELHILCGSSAPPVDDCSTSWFDFGVL